MRARYPDADGIVVRDGVEIRYERYGEGWPPIMLLPTWSLVHSRHWKMQVPYLARHCDAAATRRLAARVACPVLVMHGTHDAVRGYAEGEALADCTGGALVTLAGAGHFPQARDPVRVNLLIKQFADRTARGRRSVTRRLR